MFAAAVVVDQLWMLALPACADQALTLLARAVQLVLPHVVPGSNHEPGSPDLPRDPAEAIFQPLLCEPVKKVEKQSDRFFCDFGGPKMVPPEVSFDGRS